MNIDMTPSAAFLAGVITSFHCAGMCGPLTCAMFGNCAKREAQLASGSYQLARILSYTLIGAGLGAMGESAAGFFTRAWLVPWAFALLFLVFAFGLEKRIAPPAFTGRIFSRLAFIYRSKINTGAMLGLATPFLPCGPLYLMFGVALVSGSVLGGAKLMLSFALGTLSLYWIAQLQFFRLQAHFSFPVFRWTQRGLSLIAAALLIWRGAISIGLASPLCPLCR